MQRSVRLFLRDGLITNEQALSYDYGRIAVGIPTHLAVRAPHERRPRGVSFGWLSCIVARHRTLTTSTLPTGILGIDPTSHDMFIPRLIPGVFENATF